MLRLNPDNNFHFELLRILASTPDRIRLHSVICIISAYASGDPDSGAGADVAELLNVYDKLVPGDFETWYTSFIDLAKWVESTIEPGHDHEKVTLREVYLRASRYYFAAQFFLHANWEDPRRQYCWEKWVECFDKAAANFPIPAERKTLQADGFEVPVILVRSTLDDTPRSVILICNGLDGSMEEMIHFHGFQALERGYHIVLFEGPGQCTVRRQQNLGFIHDWEKVVTPVVDYVETLPFVDSRRIALLGNSLGGYLAARAAAFEHRLAAVMCIDGLFDIYQGFGQIIGAEAMEHEKAGDKETFLAKVKERMKGSTHHTWLVNQIDWAFKGTTFEVMQTARKMRLEGLMHKVQCPVFVGDAERDLFDEIDQPGMLANALGDKATLRKFTSRESADAHCHVGATVFLNQVMMKWLKEQLNKRLVANGH